MNQPLAAKRPIILALFAGLSAHLPTAPARAEFVCAPGTPIFCANEGVEPGDATVAIISNNVAAGDFDLGVTVDNSGTIVGNLLVDSVDNSITGDGNLDVGIDTRSVQVGGSVTLATTVNAVGGNGSLDAGIDLISLVSIGGDATVSTVDNDLGGDGDLDVHASLTSFGAIGGEARASTVANTGGGTGAFTSHASLTAYGTIGGPATASSVGNSTLGGTMDAGATLLAVGGVGGPATAESVGNTLGSGALSARVSATVDDVAGPALAGSVGNTVLGDGELDAATQLTVTGLVTGEASTGAVGNSVNGSGSLDAAVALTNLGTIGGDASASSIGNGIGANGNVFADVTVDNRGTIVGNLTAEAIGMSTQIGDLSARVSVVNHGLIEGNVEVTSVGNTSAGLGDFATGVSLENRGRINGLVTMASAGNEFGGFDFSGPMVLDNYGTIASPGSAIEFDGSDAVFTSHAGSRVVGLIDIIDTNSAEFRFRGGNYYYVYLAVTPPSIDAGGAPFFNSGTEIYVVDPTALAMESRSLGDLAGSLDGLLESRFDGAAPGYGWLEAAGHDKAAWGSFFAAGRLQSAGDGLTAGSSFLGGGVIGLDLARGPDLTLGVLAGGAFSSIWVTGSHLLDTNLAFGGVYARANRGDFFIGGDLLAGFGSSESERRIASNVVPGGEERAVAEYGSWFLSPSVEVGLNRVRPDELMLTPSASLRYVGAWFEGYEESGSSADLTVGDRQGHTLIGRVQIALSPERPTIQGAHEIDWSAHVGLAAVGQLGDRSVDAELVGQPLPFDLPGGGSQYGVYVGGSFDVRLSETANLFVGGEGTYWFDGTLSGNLNAGLRVGF